MCGRFGVVDPRQLATRGLTSALRLAPHQVEAQLEALDREAPGAVLTPRYNIAPSQPILAALERRKDGQPERRLALLRWGLVPSWAPDPSIGSRLANARAETVATKPAFRGAWRASRRCLVPADAFYEWADVHDVEADPRNGDPGSTGRRRVAPAPKPRRQPYAIRMTDDGPFCFAGLWDVWRPTAPADAAQGEGAAEDAPGEAPGETARPWLVTCTLITTSPNRVLGAVHDRMPVIIPPDRYDVWLGRDTPPEAAAALLTPYPDAAMRAYPVSTWVNAPAHDDPTVLDPLPPDPST